MISLEKRNSESVKLRISHMKKEISLAVKKKIDKQEPTKLSLALKF